MMIKCDGKIIQVPSCPSLKIQHFRGAAAFCPVESVVRGEIISLFLLMDFSVHYCLNAGGGQAALLTGSASSLTDAKNCSSLMFEMAERFSAIRLHSGCADRKRKSRHKRATWLQMCEVHGRVLFMLMLKGRGECSLHTNTDDPESADQNVAQVFIHSSRCLNPNV